MLRFTWSSRRLSLSVMLCGDNPAAYSRITFSHLRARALPLVSPLLLRHCLERLSPRHCCVRVLPSSTPSIYVGAKAREALGPDAFTAVLAHEFGHSLCTTTAGLDVLSWGLRLFGLPVFTAVALEFLHGRLPWVPGRTGLAWLTVAALVWLLYRWLLLILHRPAEYAADRYAVEVTRSHAAYIEGLKRLATIQPYNVLPNLVDALGMNSHPCVLWRTRRIEKLRQAFENEVAEKVAKKSTRRRGKRK